MLQMTIDGREIPVGSQARLVWISEGRFDSHPPGFAAYHRMNRAKSEWPRYIADVDNPGFSKPIPEGRERHQTKCGILIYEQHYEDGVQVGERFLHGIRADVAALIGRPCRRCWA